MQKQKWINQVAINQKHNEDTPIVSQKQDQTLKLECLFNLLKEEKLKAEENVQQ